MPSKSEKKNTLEMLRSDISNHAWTNNHSIDFENRSVIDEGDNRVRKTLESWHTALTNEAENNFIPLPGQYSMILF